MTHRLRVAAAAVLVAAVGFGAAATADEKGESVAQRQAVMKSIGTHFAAIRSILTGGDDVTGVAKHAAAISNLAAVVPTMFPEGTSLEDGYDTEAKPEIWSDWDRFVQVAETARTEAAGLAEIAQGGDGDAATAQFAALGRQGCSGCHTPFRQKDD